jgi:serine phosphatase RsbU (regulator of sigma subunit)
MLTGVATCGVWLRNPELEAFDLAAAYGMDVPLAEAQEQLRFHPSNVSPVLLVLLDSPQPVELSRENDRDLLPGPFWEAASGDQVVLLSLRAQNRRVGSLIVTFDSQEMPMRLHGKRRSMLSGIANQAAAAIENVRLATAHEEEAWISWALLEVSRAISLATTVDDMLAHVVRLTPLLAGVDRCAAFLVEPSSGDFVAAEQHAGHGTQATRLHPMRLAPGDLPLLDLAVATRQPQRADDAAASDLVPAAWSERVGSKTLMALPLVAQEAVLGALLVDDVDTADMSSQRREDILAGIAQQVGLALENFYLQAQERERARMAQELQVAQRIQASYLPQENPHVEGYSLAHTWQAAREVGGDFYDFIPLAQGRLGLLMADVADKGMPAALFMATSLILLRVSAHNYQDPQAVLERSNHLIGAHNQADMFVTTWYGVLDPARHVLDYANAGHSLALLVRGQDGEIVPLRTPGMPLGILPDPQVGRSRVDLVPGDTVVLYTDGVIDALDEDGAEFGQDRLEGVLFGNYNGSAREILDAVMAAVRRHGGATPIFDDITLVVVKRQA